MAFIGTKGSWTLQVPSGVAERQTPGINPTNEGSWNEYHLKIQHQTGEDGPSGLQLSDSIIALLSTNSVRMEMWYKPIFGADTDGHIGWLTFRSSNFGEAPANNVPFVYISHNQTEGKVELKWGILPSGGGAPLFDGSKILAEFDPGDVVGVRAWCVDVPPDKTQFYIQYYDGTEWKDAANYLVSGAYGIMGKYQMYSQGTPDMDDTDEDWFDDFWLYEDDSPPGTPP